MISQIDHLGIAVADLEKAIALYRDVLGLKFVGIEDLPDRGLRVAVFVVKGVHIELLESTSPESAIGKFIEKKGEGLHHVAFKTDGVQEELDRLADAGIALIDKNAQPGAHGSQVAFLHPKSTRRVLMELCEHGSE